MFVSPTGVPAHARDPAAGQGTAETLMGRKAGRRFSFIQDNRGCDGGVGALGRLGEPE